MELCNELLKADILEVNIEKDKLPRKKRKYNREKMRITRKRNDMYRKFGIEPPHDAQGGRYYMKKTSRKYNKSGKYKGYYAKYYKKKDVQQTTSGCEFSLRARSKRKFQLEE